MNHVTTCRRSACQNSIGLVDGYCTRCACLKRRSAKQRAIGWRAMSRAERTLYRIAERYSWFLHTLVN